METSEVLNKAADLIEERGWVQGDWQRPNGLCLEGGILAALDLPMSDDVVRPWFTGRGKCPAYDAVSDYLNLGRSRQPWEFNDAEGRTASEVIEVLRACALIESAREEQDAAWETYAALVTS